MTESNIKKYERGIYIHLDKAEYERYQSLTREQKQLIRTVVKSLIYNPSLLSEPLYLLRLLQVKAISYYVCPICLMPFNSALALKQHIRYTEHAKVCPICHREFKDTDALLDHVCKKHNICVS